MAGTYTTTVRNALRALLGASKVADIDEGFLRLAEDVDTKMASYWQGTFSERPAAGQPNRFYKATDKGVIYHDTGAIWEAVMPNLVIRTPTLPATAVSGDYIVAFSNGGTLTLPASPKENAMVGVFYSNATEGSIIVKGSGTDAITGPGLSATSCRIAPNTGMTFMWDSSFWRVIAGKPRLENTYSSKTFSKAEMEAGVEISAGQTAYVVPNSASEVVTVGGAPTSSMTGVPVIVPPGQKIKGTQSFTGSVLLLN